MDLTSLMEGFSAKRVMVVGDVGLDRYVYGVCSRLCPEAPVPVFTPTKTESRAGLAGNVAANLSALGAQVKLCATIGCDQDGVDLQDTLDRLGVIGVEKYLVKTDVRTTVKTRYVSDRHLLLRLDEEEKAFLDTRRNLFLQGLGVESHWADAIIVQDYGKGLIDRDMITCLIASGKPVIVDPSPKQDPNIYYGVDYLKPNAKEVKDIQNNLELDMVEKIIQTLNLKGMLVTLGESGMAAYLNDSNPMVIRTDISALRKEVFDVCGAGDTVTAVFALGIASGLHMFDSADLANAAASIVVGKYGTATVSPEELEEVYNVGKRD